MGAPAIPGDVQSWTTSRMWQVMPRVVEKGFGSLAPLSVFLEQGVIPRTEGDGNNNRLSDNLDGYQRVLPGDLVFNKLRTWQGGLGASRFEGIVSPAYYVCRPTAQVEPRFLHFLLRSAPYRAELARVSKWMPPSQFDIAWEDLRILPLRIPSLSDQRRIADFLDDQVGRLDTAISIRERQVARIGEWEISNIAWALSGAGLKPTKPTGLGWLPAIPASWSLGPVYGYYDVRLGKMLNEERATAPGQRVYLRNANVHWFEISTENLASMSFEPQERERYRLRSGDLLVCEGGAGVAEAAVWRGQVQECYYQKSLHRVRAVTHLPVEWLMVWLRLAKVSGVFESQGNLATIPHLTGEQLRESRIPIPPDAGPLLVALSDSLAKTARAKARLVASVRLLAERKQALIAAAVTGQLDVTIVRSEV